MQKFKKQFIFLFSTLAVCSYLSFRYFPKEETKPVLSVKEDENYVQVYLLDEESTLVPLNIPINEKISDEEKIQLMVDYMNGKQKIKGFTPLFTSECKVPKVQFNDDTINIDFDYSLKNYKKENELRVLESLTWGALQIPTIKKVVLSMNSKRIQQMPLNGTPIPNELNKKIGINQFETAVSSLHQSSNVIVYCEKDINGKHYIIPKSKRIEKQNDQIKEDITQIVSDISVSSQLVQPIYTEQIEIQKCNFKDGILTVDFNKNILSSDKSLKKDIYDCLILSLSMINGVEKIKVSVDGVSVMPSGNDCVRVCDLIYNKVNF